MVCLNVICSYVLLNSGVWCSGSGAFYPLSLSEGNGNKQESSTHSASLCSWMFQWQYETRGGIHGVSQRPSGFWPPGQCLIAMPHAGTGLLQAGPWVWVILGDSWKSPVGIVTWTCLICFPWLHVKSWFFLGDLHDLGDHMGGVRPGHGVSGCLEGVSKYSRIPNLVAI